MILKTSPRNAFSPWTLIAVIAAFFTYYCMYAFRKPFTILEYNGTWYGGLALQTVVVVSQIIGYTAAKFLGTRFCSELHRENVFKGLTLCILGALASLALVGVTPKDYIMIPLFLNGLSLGMVWGLVMRPLEGRGSSEFLLAGLSCSFIIASGDVKSTAKWVLDQLWFHHISGGNPYWMPLVTACLYLIPFLIVAYILSKVPKPTLTDIELRSERHAMKSEDRKLFVKQLLNLLIPLVIVYFLLTVFRSYRDDFQGVLFEEAGVDLSTNKSAFANAERIVAFIVLAITATIILIQDNLSALRASLIAMAIGCVIPLAAVFLRKAGIIDGFTWMVIIGIGVYLSYIPVQCIIFERLVAFTRSPGNSVFAMMLFDGIGYIGVILLYPLGDKIGGESRITNLDHFCWILAFIGLTCLTYVFLHLPQYRGKFTPHHPQSRSDMKKYWRN